MSKLRILGIFASLALILLGLCGYFLTKEVNNELISPISEAAEEPSPTPTVSQQSRKTYYFGKASWYGEDYCLQRINGRLPCHTASGEIFDEDKFTSACADIFPFGSRLIVSYKENSVEVVCNDRGGFTKRCGRIVDLSKAAFKALAPLSKGVIWVQVEVVREGDGK